MSDLRKTALAGTLSFLRWEHMGECRCPGWEGPPPTAAELDSILCAALAQPEVKPDVRIYWHAQQGWQVEWLADQPNGGQSNYFFAASPPLAQPDRPTAGGRITSSGGLLRSKPAPDAAAGVPVTGASTQTVQFQPTVDGPTLPDTDYGLCFYDEGGMHEADGQGYTAAQMLDFRAEAYAEGVAQERERCAKKAEDEDVAPTDDPIGVQQCIAASIRKG